MKRNIFIFLIVAGILIVFLTLIFAKTQYDFENINWGR